MGMSSDMIIGVVLGITSMCTILYVRGEFEKYQDKTNK